MFDIKSVIHKISDFSNNKKHLVSDVFADLAPVDEIDNGDEYFKALDYALNNPKVCNIALTGPYGSGKSSIIDTYLKRKTKKRYIRSHILRISMASFTGLMDNSRVNSDSSSNGNNDVNLKIEQGIFKQLFYKVKSNKIPQSRYRKLHKIKSCLISLNLGAVILISLLLIYVFKQDVLVSCVEKVQEAFNWIPISKKTAIISCAAFLFLIDIMLSKAMSILISKVKVTGLSVGDAAKISVDQNDMDSSFDKNIDEIMYFFETSKYDIIFFEDIDRFNNAEIFTKLRELNFLLNHNDSIKRRIRFVYAVKDDMFEGTDRTKFFDFIIPVIPVMNSTNSGDVLLKMLSQIKQTGIEHGLTQEYILDISPYISDMRVLKNIVNEFVIYKRTLQASQELDLEDEKMFAMITFKNICPKDFADIQFERGIVKDVFNELSAVKSDIAESIKKSISEKQIKIESINQENLTSVIELKSAMLSALCNWHGAVSNLSGNSGTVSSITILDDDFDIQQLIDGQYHQVTYKPYDSVNPKNHRINNDTLKEYCRRIINKKLLTVEIETRLHNEIEMLKKDLYSIEALNASGMLHNYSERLNDNEKITFLHKNPFLLFAIRRGYIDETYANYINYFQGESLTREDMNFILSIKNHRALEPNHSLTRIDRIVNQLQVFEFKQREILNYSLLKELLSKQTQTYTDKTNAFLSQFSGEDDVYWRFIESFVQETDYQDRFVMHLTNNWNGFWEFIYCNPAISDDKKAFYLALILQNATIIRIKEMDTNKSISNFMTSHKDILVLLASLNKSNHIKVDETKIIEVIAELNIKFENLDTNGVPSTILDYIYENNYYIINYHMIYCIVNFKNSSKAEFLSTQNYTTILSVGYEPLIANIHDHFNDYIHDIVLSDTNIEEEESAVCSILEKCIDDLDTCVQVIEHEKISFDSFEDCCSDLLEQNESAVKVLWDALLNSNKVSSTWRNVLQYWNAFQFTQELETFIEKNANILHADSSPVESEEFIRSFIKSEISVDAFRILIHKIGHVDMDVEFSEISEEHMTVLIDSNLISFSSDSLERLTKFHPLLQIVFISKHQDAFVDDINSIEMSGSLFEGLLQSNEISSETANAVVKRFGESFMTESCVQIIISKQYLMTNQIFHVAWNLDLSNEEKIELMLYSLQLLSADDFEMCFSSLKSHYPNFVPRTNHSAVITKTDQNLKLVHRLKEVEYITSVKEEKANSNTINAGRKRLLSLENQSLLRCRIKQKT